MKPTHCRGSKQFKRAQDETDNLEIQDGCPQILTEARLTTLDTKNQGNESNETQTTNQARHQHDTQTKRKHQQKDTETTLVIKNVPKQSPTPENVNLGSHSSHSELADGSAIVFFCTFNNPNGSPKIEAFVICCVHSVSNYEGFLGARFLKSFKWQLGTLGAGESEKFNGASYKAKDSAK